MKEDALKITDLTKNYKSFKLDNVSFTLPKGSIMGLIGENGAGKSTTLKLILNLIKKDSGKVAVFGLDNIENEKKIKKQIGVVLDESSFHYTLTPLQISAVMKNIFADWDESLYASYLAKFKLPEKKIIKELSRGMKVKLSIAVALSHRPKLLILDEATSGLDPVVRNEILDMLLEFIQSEENSVLLSSHITGDLEKICDYITFIRNGKIVVSEAKDLLLEQYGILKCASGDLSAIKPEDYAGYRKSRFGCEVLMCNKARAKTNYPDFVVDDAGLEDIMLFYAREENI
ncbi:MAG: ABC transporter ATP-binding protein [Bacillota bacterium]|nr:ABC transporter ATP-binding protein [Bacillota bacterium]